MKIWTPSTHFLPSEGLLMPPQLLLFFKLPYSQLIRYSNIINHLRQEQLSVFSKSGSEIPSSPPLTPIKAFPTAFIYFCNTGAPAHPFVKLPVYINYCKIVHKHGIHASSSRNCSHWRAWHVKLGRLVRDQHSQDTKLSLYVFILYPNSKVTSPAMSNKYLLSAALRGIICSVTQSLQQLGGMEHRRSLTTALLRHQWIPLCTPCAHMACRSRWIPQHTFHTFLCIQQINMHWELFWVTRWIYLVWKLHFFSF